MQRRPAEEDRQHQQRQAGDREGHVDGAAIRRCCPPEPGLDAAAGSVIGRRRAGELVTRLAVVVRVQAVGVSLTLLLEEVLRLVLA